MSEEQQQQTPEPIGLGVMLRQAREKAGLTTAQIADQLRLKVSIIENLESEAFDDNMSVTFTKGYLKLYAKQVNLPEQEVLEAFERTSTKLKDTTKLQSFSRRVSREASDDRLMMVTYMILALVIALVVLWWFQQSGSDSAATESSLTSLTANVATDNATTDTDSQPQAAVPATANTQSQPAVTTAEPDAIEATGVEVAQADVPQDLAERVVAEAEAQSESDDAPQTEMSDLASSQPALSQDDSTPQGGDVGSQLVELVFEFSGDCWMNLVDASGEAIAYGVKAQGRVMPVSGVPPFEVILGAPEVVSISYNGEPVDMTVFAAGRTARFSLPMTN